MKRYIISETVLFFSENQLRLFGIDKVSTPYYHDPRGAFGSMYLGTKEDWKAAYKHVTGEILDDSDFEGKELKANETADLYVSVKYLKELEDVTKRTQEMNVEINVTLEDYDGNVITEDIKSIGFESITLITAFSAD